MLKDNSNIAPLDTAIMTELASNDIDGEEFIPRILNAVGLSEYTWSSTDKFESMIKGSLKAIDPTIDEDLSTITRREVFADSVLVSNIYKPRQKRKQR